MVVTLTIIGFVGAISLVDGTAQHGTRGNLATVNGRAELLGELHMSASGEGYCDVDERRGIGVSVRNPTSLCLDSLFDLAIDLRLLDVSDSSNVSFAFDRSRDSASEANSGLAITENGYFVVVLQDDLVTDELVVKLDMIENFYVFD